MSLSIARLLALFISIQAVAGVMIELEFWASPFPSAQQAQPQPASACNATQDNRRVVRGDMPYPVCWTFGDEAHKWALLGCAFERNGSTASCHEETAPRVPGVVWLPQQARVHRDSGCRFYNAVQCGGPAVPRAADGCVHGATQSAPIRSFSCDCQTALQGDAMLCV